MVTSGPETGPPPLTKEQMGILDLFLMREADYVTDRAKVASDFGRLFSTRWTDETADILVSRGLLVSEAHGPEAPEEGPRRYSLVRNVEGFRTLVMAYLQTLSHQYGYEWAKASTTFLESDYLRKHLTTDFVRRILAARGVEVRYCVNRSGPERLQPAGERDVIPMAQPELQDLVFLISGQPTGEFPRRTQKQHQALWDRRSPRR